MVQGDWLVQSAAGSTVGRMVRPLSQYQLTCTHLAVDVHLLHAKPQHLREFFGSMYTMAGELLSEHYPVVVLVTRTTSPSPLHLSEVLIMDASLPCLTEPLVSAQCVSVREIVSLTPSACSLPAAKRCPAWQAGNVTLPVLSGGALLTLMPIAG
jgi:hypothetical protein